ncbi:MAG TPA: hypothetical protein VN786_12890 [Acidimicrobiales bacterium]|nr:hypothetical protein [Acidimicrobiales bacterium]
MAQGCILVTGEVDRTTEFERGIPASHQAWDGQHWGHDAEVIDDGALVVNLRGKGLVVITGCGHAGVVNIVRHAMRLAGVTQVAAVIGGFHLSGPAFEPIIGPTVAALVELGPGLIAPATAPAGALSTPWPAPSPRRGCRAAQVLPTTCGRRNSANVAFALSPEGSYGVCRYSPTGTSLSVVAITPGLTMATSSGSPSYLVR